MKTEFDIRINVETICVGHGEYPKIPVISFVNSKVWMDKKDPYSVNSDFLKLINNARSIKIVIETE